MSKNSFGEFIEKLRKGKNLSQRKLADLAGVTNSTISRIESDLVVPDLETIEKLSSALKIEKALLLSKVGYLDIPEDFILIARKTGELSQEDRAKIFHTMNDTIEDFLKNLKEEEEED